jgi:hypothetical protein
MGNEFAYGLLAGALAAGLFACAAAALVGVWLNWRGHRRTHGAVGHLAEAIQESHDAQLRVSGKLAELVMAVGNQIHAAEARRNDDRIG